MEDDKVIVLPYDEAWPEQFREWGQRLRRALGPAAARIDHIGSTAVPGLAAKPIVDIQISVASFDPWEPVRQSLAHVGLYWREHNPDRSKRYFREAPGERRMHIHVRLSGSWSEQLALLFRDYLRCHEADCAVYADVKRHLAAQYETDRHGYTAAKSDRIWDILRRADRWSQQTGWVPGESDA